MLLLTCTQLWVQKDTTHCAIFYAKQHCHFLHLHHTCYSKALPANAQVGNMLQAQAQPGNHATG